MSKTTMRKGKQDDKNSTAMREIQSQHPANKKCFDCDQRGPTYVNMTIGSFVCTKCSGLLRGINPPHRIKSISMSTFSNEEVEMMRSKGNAWCAAVWCGSYNKANNPVNFKDDEKIKEFIISKYEKKRYYVDPSQANFSSIKTQLTGGSTGSGDSHGSYKLSSSSLIGSTLKARVDPNSVLGQSSGAAPPTSSVVSRPDFLPQAPAPVLAQPQPPAQIKPRENNLVANIDNFADFDGAAFDSLPPDPLTAPPPTNTLPPTNRKINTGPGPVSQPAPAGDKYSALKELDDLFRTTTVAEPQSEVAPPPPPPSQAAVTGGTGGGLFGSNLTALPTLPTTILSQPQPNNGLWAANSPSGGGSSTWGQPARTSPMWTPQWTPAGDTSETGNTNTTGWAEPGLKPLDGGQSFQNTNPFGTSPSTTTLGQVFSDNNNDLFAAAPKPFISDKPGLSTGNPWSTEAVSVSSFTPNMMPAHNPNNPFL